MFTLFLKCIKDSCRVLKFTYLEVLSESLLKMIVVRNKQFQCNLF
jgi:hypothetical protein